MKIWTDKDGNKLTFKEFIERWKKGIEGITQLQQLKMQLNSFYIMIIGILCGLVITIIGFERLWWLTIVLSGALFNVTMQWIGVWQKKRLLENVKLNFGGEDAKR